MLGFADIEALIPIAFAVIYILSQVAGIFKKSQENGDEAPAKRSPPSPSKGRVAGPLSPPRGPAPPQTPAPPRARTRAPTPPRGAVPPRPPRVPTPPRPARGVDSPRPQRIEPRPARPQIPRTPQPIARTREPPRERVQPREDRERRKRGAGFQELRTTIKTTETIARPETAKSHLEHDPAKHGRRRRKLTPTERIDRILRTRSGLQAGIILSEILAPPVALRDDHLMR